MGKRKPIKKEKSLPAQNNSDQDKKPKANKKKIVYRSYTLGKRMGLR